MALQALHQSIAARLTSALCAGSLEFDLSHAGSCLAFSRLFEGHNSPLGLSRKGSLQQASAYQSCMHSRTYSSAQSPCTQLKTDGGLPLHLHGVRRLYFVGLHLACVLEPAVVMHRTLLLSLLCCRSMICFVRLAVTDFTQNVRLNSFGEAPAIA